MICHSRGVFIMQKDKLKHFAYSLLAAFLVGLINPIYGVCFASGLGIGKEYGDSKSPGNRWSWGDILADALGIISGTLLALIIRFLGGYFYD